MPHKFFEHIVFCCPLMNIHPTITTKELGKREHFSPTKYELVCLTSFWKNIYAFPKYFYIADLLKDCLFSSSQKSKFQCYSAKYESYQTHCFATSYKSALWIWLFWRNFKKWQNNPPDNSYDLLSFPQKILHGSSYFPNWKMFWHLCIKNELEYKEDIKSYGAKLSFVWFM